MNQHLVHDYTNLVNHGIEEFFETQTFDLNGLKVMYKPNLHDIKRSKATVDFNKEEDRKKQFTAPIEAKLTVDISVQNDLPFDSNGKNIQKFTIPNVDFCTFPLLKNNGFQKGREIYPVISKYVPASGWYMHEKKGVKVLTYSNAYGDVFEIFPAVASKHGIKTQVLQVAFNQKTSSGRSGIRRNNKMRIMDFIKAYTGDSYDCISKRLPYDIIFNTIALGTTINSDGIPLTGTAVNKNFFDIEASREACCFRLLRSISTYKGNRNTVVHVAQNMFKRNTTAGNEKIIRIYNMLSLNRFRDMYIKDVAGNMQLITRRLANEIDDKLFKREIESISIYMNADDKKPYHTINAFKTEKYLTKEELYGVLKEYLLWLEDDIGVAHEANDCANLVIASYSHNVKLELEKLCNSLENNLFSKVAVGEKEVNEINLKNITDAILKMGHNKELPSLFYRLQHRDPNNLNAIFVQPQTTNSMANAAQSSRMMKIDSNDFRQIHSSQFSMFDDYDTPESAKVGIAVSLCEGTIRDDYSLLAAKVYPVINGQIQATPVYINSVQEKNRVIAPAGAHNNIDKNGYINHAFLDGKMISIKYSEVDYEFCTDRQTRSMSGNYAIFTYCDGHKRQQMNISALNAAIPTLKCEQPLVRYKDENSVGVLRAKDILIQNLLNNGFYEYVDESSLPNNLYLKIISNECDPKLGIIHITLSINQLNNGALSPVSFPFGSPESLGVVTHDIPIISGTSSKTMRNPRIALAKNGRYALNDIVIYNPDVDMSVKSVIKGFNNDETGLVTYNENGLKQNIDEVFGNLALGENVRVLFKVDNGRNYEDAAQVSEDLVARMGLTTTQVYTFKDNNKDRTDEYTYNEYSLPKIGQYYHSKDRIVTRIKVKDGTIQSEMKLDDKTEGTVISAVINDYGNFKEVVVTLSITLPLNVGDKISGFHGNKSVVGKIIKRSDMDIAEDGRPFDLVLNPSGVVQRENVGQIIEEVTYEIARRKGGVIELDRSVGLNLDEIEKAAIANGVVEQRIINPHTGEYYPEKAFIGTCYFTRSSHTSRSKWNACGNGNNMTSEVTGQTSKGQGGAQTKGEMEQDGYISAGAEKYAQALSTLQSDNSYSREFMYRYLMLYPLCGFDPENETRMNKLYEFFSCNTEAVEGDENPFESGNFQRLQAYQRFLGYNINADEHSYSVEVLNDKRINEISVHMVSEYSCERHGVSGRNFKNTAQSGRVPLLERYRSWELPNASDTPVGEKTKIIMPAFILSDVFPSLFYCVTHFFDKETGKIKFKLGPVNRNYLKALLTNRYSSEQGSNENKSVHFAMIKTGQYAGLPIYVTGSKGKDFLLDTGKDGGAVLFGIKSEEDIASNAEEFFAKILPYYDLKEVIKQNGPMEYFKVPFSIEDIRKMQKDDPSFNCDAYDNLTLSEKKNFAEPYDFIERYGTGKLINVFGVSRVLLPPEPYVPGSASHDDAIGVLSVAVNNLTRANVKLNFTKTWKCLCNIAGYVFGKNQKADDIRDFNVAFMLTSHKSRNSLFRDTLLAKLVTYSGRSVISVDPDLKIGYAGIPIKMLVTTLQYNIIGIVWAACNKGLGAEAEGLQFDISKLSPSARRLCNYLQETVDETSGLKQHEIYEKIVALSLKKASELQLSWNNFKDYYQGLKDILNLLSDYFPVELNRAPTLWRFGSNVFKFIPIDGDAITISPLSCKPFNADFDGDQMAEVTILTQMGIRDCYKLMFGRNLIIDERQSSVFAINQDMVLGLYTATEKDISSESNIVPRLAFAIDYSSLNTFATDKSFIPVPLEPLWDKIYRSAISFDDVVALKLKKENKYAIIVNTVGRILFNSLFGTAGFNFDESKLCYDYEINKDTIDKLVYKRISDLCYNQADKLREEEIAIENMIETDPEILWKPIRGTRKKELDIIDRIKTFGFKAATTQNVSLSFFDFKKIKDEIDIQMRNNESGKSIIEIAQEDIRRLEAYRRLGFISEKRLQEAMDSTWDACIAQLRNISGEALKKSKNMSRIVLSGARGSKDNIMRICGAVGIAGGTMITSSFFEGLKPVELHALSYAGRQSQIATQKGAPDSGELTRSLKYLMESLTVSESDEPCLAKARRVELEYTSVCSLNNPRWYKVADDEEFEDKTWRKISEFLKLYEVTPIVEENLLRLFAPLGYMYVEDENGNPSKVELPIKISARSKAKLCNRCIDFDMMAEEFELQNFDIELLKTFCVTVNDKYFVVTKENVDDFCEKLEDLGIHAVYMYTILGCNTIKDGCICKRCYGISPITKKFYDTKLNAGYIAAQHIGEGKVQGNMDTHKSQGLTSNNNLDKVILSHPEEINSPKEYSVLLSETLNVGFALNPKTIMTCAYPRVQHGTFIKYNEVIKDISADKVIPATSILHWRRLPIEGCFEAGEPLINDFSIKQCYDSMGWFYTANELWDMYTAIAGGKADLRITELVIRSLFNNFEVLEEFNFSEANVSENESNRRAKVFEIYSRSICPALNTPGGPKGKILLLGANHAVKEGNNVLSSIIRSDAKSGLAHAGLSRKVGSGNSQFYLSLTHQHSKKHVDTFKVDEIISKNKDVHNIKNNLDSVMDKEPKEPIKVHATARNIFRNNNVLTKRPTPKPIMEETKPKVPEEEVVVETKEGLSKKEGNDLTTAYFGEN